MKKVLLFLLMSMPYLHANIASCLLQSKAAACGQKDQWQQAQAHMHQLITDNPDQPDLLYDSGVAAYRLKEFATAAAYFENVTKIPDVHQDLKKQAYFNLGNTKVALGQLPEAITQYEHVLAIEPKNQQARHNLEKVKEMLKQQQKQNQQQQQKKDQSKKNQNNNDQNTQNSQDESKDNQTNDAGQQENKNGSSNNKHDKQESSSQKRDNGTNESSTGDQEKKQNSDGDHEGQQKSEADDKSSQQDRNQQQNQLRDSHDASSEQQTKQQQKKQRSKGNAQPIKNGDKAQEMQHGMLEDTENDTQQHAQEKQFGSGEQWMARVLAQQEKADKAAQKALIKTNLNNQLAGRNGQNCW